MSVRSKVAQSAKRTSRAGTVSSRHQNGSLAPGARMAGGFKIGRERFAAISAIEGLNLTAEMERAFREFDRKGLSADERRRRIIAKYCK